MSSNHRSMLNENEPFSISRESFESYRRSFVRQAFSSPAENIVSNPIFCRISPPALQSTHTNLPRHGKAWTPRRPVRRVPQSNPTRTPDQSRRLRMRKVSRMWDSMTKENNHPRKRASLRALATTLRRHRQEMPLDQLRVIEAFIFQAGSVGRVLVKVPS